MTDLEEKALYDYLCIQLEKKEKKKDFTLDIARELQSFWIKKQKSSIKLKKYRQTKFWIRKSPRFIKFNNVSIKKTNEREFLLILDYLCEHVSKTENYGKRTFFSDTPIIFKSFERGEMYSIYFDNWESLCGYVCIKKKENGLVTILATEVFEIFCKKGIGKKAIYLLENILKSEGIKIVECYPLQQSISFWISVGYVRPESETYLFRKFF